LLSLFLRSALEQRAETGLNGVPRCAVGAL
jgi:hypothetical protein